MAGRRAKIVWFVAALACLFLAAGCFPHGGRAPGTEFYTLDYAARTFAGACLDETIKIDRFSVAQVYDGPAMVYNPQAYRLASYHYNKWRTGPGDMATELLSRDFRSSGLFRAVFSYLQPQNARFELDGAIGKFLESRDGNAWTAVLDMDVALIDQSKPDAASRVVFQKRYLDREPIQDRTPAGFARGMSAAMSRISAEIIDDVYEAVSRAEK